MRIPLVRSHVYAGGTEREREVVLVRAEAVEGGEGWGECSALSSVGYGSETVDSSWRTLRDDLAPQWLVRRTVERAAPMAYAAIEEASIDLSLRSRDVSLVDELFTGAPPRGSISWCAVVGLHDDAQTMLRDVDDALAAGAAQVKLKIAPGHDLGPLAAVRDRYPDLALAADANGSYPSSSAIPAELAALGLTYLEQPLPPDDFVGSSHVEVELGIPVALDESVDSLQRLADARDRRAGSIINVKAARLGGLSEVQSVLTDLQRTGTRAFVGGMLETAVGRAIGLAIAAQEPCSLPSDLGPTSRYFVDDIGPSFEADEVGRLSPAQGPGIGVDPDPAVLERFCIDRVVIRP